MMISPKNLIKMARKWQRIVAIRRKRISLPGTSGITNTMKTVEKGHFAAYTVDRKRYVLPIEYLNSYIFQQLLIFSEEEFGPPGNGPITFPCDSVLMDYATNLIRYRVTEDLEKALFMSIANRKCSLSSSLHQQQASQQLLTCVF